MGTNERYPSCAPGRGEGEVASDQVLSKCPVFRYVAALSPCGCFVHNTGPSFKARTAKRRWLSRDRYPFRAYEKLLARLGAPAHLLVPGSCTKEGTGRYWSRIQSLQSKWNLPPDGYNTCSRSSSMNSSKHLGSDVSGPSYLDMPCFSGRRGLQTSYSFNVDGMNASSSA